MKPFASQRRALRGIEGDLAGSDPRLARLFSMFTSLTRGEELPGTERLRAHPVWMLARLRRAAGLNRLSASRRARLRPTSPLMAALLLAYAAAAGG